MNKVLAITIAIILMIMGIGLVQNYLADNWMRCPHYESATGYMKYECKDHTYYVQTRD